jgi:hypothetical protein
MFTPLAANALLQHKNIRRKLTTRYATDVQVAFEPDLRKNMPSRKAVNRIVEVSKDVPVHIYFIMISLPPSTRFLLQILLRYRHKRLENEYTCLLLEHAFNDGIVDGKILLRAERHYSSV